MTLQKITKVIREELTGFHPRLLLARLLVAPLPPFIGGRTRVAIFRLLGFKIGPGSIFWGTPTLIGGAGLERRLTIGSQSRFNLHCLFDLTASIHIGDRVSCGPYVMFITSRHDLGDRFRRVGPLNPAPIEVCTGSWIGAGALIMPGVTIGPSSVVAAGAVVTHDVPANTIAAGIPARVIRELESQHEHD